MTIKTNDRTQITVSIADSTVEGSKIGCIINEFDLLDISIKGLFPSILEEIREIEDRDVRETLELAHYSIYQLYLNNKNEFLKLARLSSCSLGQDPTSIQMHNIIKFWIIGKYCKMDIDMKLVAELSGKFGFNEDNVWFFSPSNSVTKSIEKSIAIIRHFLKVAEMESIENGKCFISKITLTEDFNCNDCKDGSIELENTDEIIEDFVDGKKTVINFKDKALQVDFINIQIDKNLKILCGNCISDIERVPGNIAKLIKLGGPL
jgi:hypothetical protein